MRRRGAVLLAVGLAAALAVASASSQDPAPGKTHFWPHRTFYIPVSVEAINQASPKPTHLQLYSALNRGKWQAGAKLAVTGLEDIGEGKKGFKFTADRDGEYEFSVQYWYDGGESSPRTADELNPMLGVVIDTTPPVVRLAAGANGVRWSADDDYLDPRSVRLEAKLPAWTEWRSVTDREFKAADSYAWQLRPGQTLEVRVRAKDRAGNEGLSPIVRVPGNEALGTSFPKAPSTGVPDWVPPGGPPRDPLTVPGGGNLPKPRIAYVSGKDITVDYTIQRMGRSGIKAARLFVLRDKDPRGWDLAGEFKVDLQPDNREQSLSLKYTAKDEGVYGFYVAPESGAGVKADPPRKDDPPMTFVVVDWTEPYVKITGVRVTAGGVRGPVVEIAWETNDQNLMADPISVEYSVDQTAVQWKEIKYRLGPGTPRADAVGQNRYVGTYAWEVPDENLWKFHVRIRSVDNAGNTGKDVWKDEVIVDLEKPAAGITGVRGAGGAAPTPAPDSSSPVLPKPEVTRPDFPKPDYRKPDAPKDDAPKPEFPKSPSGTKPTIPSGPKPPTSPSGAKPPGSPPPVPDLPVLP